MRSLRPFALACAAATFMAVISPFGMGPAPLATRLLYWLAVLNMGTALVVAGARLRSRLRSEERPWLKTAATAAAVTLPMTVVVWAATRIAFGPQAPARPWNLLLPVMVVSLGMTALNTLAARRSVQTHAAPSGAPPPRFLERLPAKLRGAEVYAIEAEDHYLRLHTSRGSDLILMRLADAVVELEGLEGAQTHRSWWVARDGVTDARRSDGRATLTLKSGAEAPVSRTYAKALREAGWF